MKRIKGKYFVYLFLLIFTFVLIPNSVDATAVGISNYKCDTLKVDGGITCVIYGDVLDTSIDNVSGKLTISSGNDLISVSKFVPNVNDDGVINVGKDINLGSFKVNSVGGYGNAQISLTLKFNEAQTTRQFDSSATKIPIKILSNVAALSSIRVDNKTIPNFSSTIYNYAVTTSATSALISATGIANNTTITGVGKKSLVCGGNTFSIKAVSEDKSKTLVYKVVINRTCNGVVTLKNLTVSSGEMTPTFNSNVFDYKVVVEGSVNKFSIDIEKGSSEQIVSGVPTNKSLVYGDNTFSITVKSQKGTKKTYKIVVTRKDDRSNNALLSSLKLDNGKIKFDKGIFIYDTKVLYNVEKVNVVAVAENLKSKITITNPSKLVVGNNKVIIKVASEKGDTQEYLINVKRLKEGEVLGDNSKIQTLKIKGYNISFNPETKTYKLKLENDVKKLAFEIKMQEDGASYNILGNNNLKDGSVITINTLSFDKTPDTYKIIIEKTNIQLFIIIGAFIVLIGVISTSIFVSSKKKKSIASSLLNKAPDINTVDNSLQNNDSVNPFEKLRNDDNSSDEIKKYDPTPYVEEAKVVDSIPDEVNNNQEFKPLLDKIEPTEEQTKQCPKCGHRINFSSAVCPYCNNKF